MAETDAKPEDPPEDRKLDRERAELLWKTIVARMEPTMVERLLQQCMDDTKMPMPEEAKDNSMSRDTGYRLHLVANGIWMLEYMYTGKLADTQAGLTLPKEQALRITNYRRLAAEVEEGTKMLEAWDRQVAFVVEGNKTFIESLGALIGWVGGVLRRQEEATGEAVDLETV